LLLLVVKGGIAMKRMSLSVAGLVGAMALGASALAQPASDNLACYRVTDSRPRGTFSVTLTNAGVTQSCSMSARAKFGCLETQMSHVVPAPPASGPASGNVGDFLCYRVFCPKPFPPAAQMSDQFGGTRVVQFRRGTFVCTPAVHGPETIIPTTTTTTTQPGPCDFSSSDQRCEGTCANGGHCSAVTSGGACECRTTACGDASAPECNGFCNEPSESCTFNLTGCSCVRIP
jgi:hypothetical protein